MRVAGESSTGSKRAAALFGEAAPGLPTHMAHSAGCRVWDEEGREYLDFVMALGAVALGYGHPDVDRAAIAAVQRGTVGALPPTDEVELAEELHDLCPHLEQVRFLKTGAEAVAAAVRLARVATGRDEVLGCGYHGWLDWCSGEPGVPEAVRGLFAPLPFNDIAGSLALLRGAADRLAAVVLEPVVDGEPDPGWLRAVREETRRAGALLVFDEIKTGLRVGLRGAAGRWGGDPDLVVMGKALGNGFPLALVGGRADLMAGVHRTWISSTLATEVVSLAAARAVLRAARNADLPGRLYRLGHELLAGLTRLAAAHPRLVERAAGIPEMCYLRFRDEATSARFARACARRGLLFKRNAYNFVSLAHDETDIARALEIADLALAEAGRTAARAD